MLVALCTEIADIILSCLPFFNVTENELYQGNSGETSACLFCPLCFCFTEWNGFSPLEQKCPVTLMCFMHHRMPFLTSVSQTASPFFPFVSQSLWYHQCPTISFPRTSIATPPLLGTAIPFLRIHKYLKYKIKIAEKLPHIYYSQKSDKFIWAFTVVTVTPKFWSASPAFQLKKKSPKPTLGPCQSFL